MRQLVVNVAGPRREKRSRTVCVIARRQLSAAPKLEEKTKGISRCGMDLSSKAIRVAQRGDVYLRTIMDLLDAGTEKPPWSTVEVADLEVQQLYAQWEAFQLQDGILYRNFLGTDGQVRWRQMLIPRSLRAPLLQRLHAGPTAGHMGIKTTQDRMMKMAYWRD